MELIEGSVVWGVAFEDGEWAEDVRLGDPDVQYECETYGEAFSQCGKALKESGKLAAHMQMHSGERRYEGETCGKAFNSSSYLAAHVWMRSGEQSTPFESDTFL